MMDAGGQAFPNEGFNGWGTPEKGMTLRDYFAAKAMQATINAWDCKNEDRAACIASIVAEESYELADAMLKAREQ